MNMKKTILLVVLVTFFSYLATPTMASATYESVNWNNLFKVIHGLLVGNKIEDIADKLIKAINDTSNTQEMDSSIAAIKKIIAPLATELQNKKFNSQQEHDDFIDSIINSIELNQLDQDIKNNIEHIVNYLFQQYPEHKNILIKDLETTASNIRRYLENNYQSLLEAATKTDPKNDGADLSIQRLKTYSYEFARAFSLKVAENATKATSSRNPYIRKAGYWGLATFAPLVAMPKAENMSPLIAWAGKAMALSMVYDEQIFYTYIKAKIIGEIARSFLNKCMSPMGHIPELDVDMKTLVIELIVTHIEMRILDATDICTVSGSYLETLLSVSNNKWLHSSATPIGALLTANCKSGRYHIGMAAQKNGFTNPRTPYYLYTSQLNDDGSSIGTYDSRSWYVITPQERLHSTEQFDTVSVAFSINPEDNPNRLRNAYREGITSVLSPFLFLKISMLSLLGIGTVAEDVYSLYSWCFKIPIAIEHTIPTTMETVNIPNSFYKTFFKPTKTTYAIQHNYASSDLQNSYKVKYNIQSRLGQALWSKDISEGNLNAFTAKQVTIDENNIASLTLHSHVTGVEIKITKVLSQQGCILRSILPVIILPMGNGNTVLLLSNCRKNTDYVLELSYRVGDEKTGEYFDGMIWFRVPSKQINQEDQLINCILIVLQTINSHKEYLKNLLSDMFIASLKYPEINTYC